MEAGARDAQTSGSSLARKREARDNFRGRPSRECPATQIPGAHRALECICGRPWPAQRVLSFESAFPEVNSPGDCVRERCRNGCKEGLCSNLARNTINRVTLVTHTL